MISTVSIEEAKKEIKKAIKPILLKAQDDVFNRKILEYGRFDVLVSPESGVRKDKLRYGDTGVNHVLAKIATKQKVAIGFDLEDIKKCSPKEKAQRLARIVDIIVTCRKAKTKIVMVRYKDARDASAFLQTLGASSQQAAQAVTI